MHMNSQKVVIVSVIGVLVLLVILAFVRKTPSEQVSISTSSQVSQVVETPSVSPGTGGLASSPPTKPVAREITLTINSPTSGATVSTSSITVSGKTSPNAEVFVNESETKADAAGNFSVQMSLDEGDNYIIVVANDADGNAAEAELTVIYNP